MSQKGQGLILLIAGLLFITVVAGGAYYLGKVTNQIPKPIATTPQTTSVISDWKSYTNSQYKISFNYPSKLEIQDDRFEDPDSLFISLFAANPNPTPPSSPIPGSAAEILQKKAAEHGGVITPPSSKIYYFSVNVYSTNYDKTPRVGISRQELENAFKNAQLNQTYQDPQTQRGFIRVADQTINGIKFTTLKIQVIPEVIIKGEQEQYSDSVVALYEGNLYEFWADDKTYFDKILQTVSFSPFN